MTAARNGVIVPEYYTTVISFETTQMIDIYPDGSQKVIGTYDKFENKFMEE